MIFDKLCGIAEAHMPYLLPVLKRAHLFHFPGVAHGPEVASRFDDFTMEETQFLWDEFRMPYSYMAVEDKHSCVVIWEEEGAKGLEVERYALECMDLCDFSVPTLADGEASEALLRMAAASKREHGELYMVVVGKLKGDSITHEKFGATFAGSVGSAMVGNKKKVLTSYERLLGAKGDKIVLGFIKNVRAAIEEIIYFNSPDRFVVAKTPAHKIRKPSNDRAPRSNERPVYTLLTPKEIRDQLGLGAGESSTGKLKVGHDRRGHYRRGHYRVYTDLRFSEEVRKKPRWIKALWVGESSGQSSTGKHHYEIQLDK